MMRLVTVIGFLLISAQTALGAPEDEVERVLARTSPPTGVVFEVVTGSETALEQVLPVVRGHARRLRARFPGLSIAVLTHGSEQFSLLVEKRGRYQALHALTAAFSADERIPVQVCGNHAAWRDKSAEDFPEYVDVVSAAPAKLEEYRQAGYTIILM